jgi:hypothetical protein
MAGTRGCVDCPGGVIHIVFIFPRHNPEPELFLFPNSDEENPVMSLAWHSVWNPESEFSLLFVR